MTAVEAAGDFSYATWFFSGAVTFGGGAESSCLIGGVAPVLTEAGGADFIYATYPGAVHPGEAWSLPATPDSFTVAPALTVPESGLLV